MDVIRSALVSLGFTEQEITMYLALLQTGTSPSSTLGKRLRLSRSTAQYTCDQLVKKGIATMTQKNNAYLFTAEAPEKLLILVDEQRKKLADKEQLIRNALGPLKQMMNAHAVLPKVQFYEGREGMIQLYDSILDMRKPIDSFEEQGNVMKLFPDYGHEFMKKRIERKIFNRCVAPSGSPHNETDPKRFIEVRNVPLDKYPFTWHIKLCEDVIGMFSFEEGATVGIGIRHPDLAKNFKLLFQYVWDSLEEKKK